MRKVFTVLLTAFAFVVCSCSSIETHRHPQADLSALKRFFVERRLNDNHRIDHLIVAELQARGFEASTGPLTMMPDGVDALVNYDDAWAWDFKSYLIQLHIDIRHPHTRRSLAVGSYRQPSVVTKEPREVIAEILNRILPANHMQSTRP